MCVAKSRLNAIQNDFWLNYAEVWSKTLVSAIVYTGLQSDEASGKKKWNTIISQLLIFSKFLQLYIEIYLQYGIGVKFNGILSSLQ